jgi:hypothetical protein
MTKLVPSLIAKQIEWLMADCVESLIFDFVSALGASVKKDMVFALKQALWNP